MRRGGRDADLIRWLCVDPRAKALVDPQGIRLLGARITGRLYLADVTIPFAVTLRNCSISERMTFEHASLPRLDLGGCYTGEIDGRAAVVHGDLNLDSIRASGEVWFNDSTIDGDLGARGGHFTHSTVEPHETEEAFFKKALDLESARILDGASVGVLFDDPNSWPAPGKLILDGFTYERLPDTSHRLVPYPCLPTRLNRREY